MSVEFFEDPAAFLTVAGPLLETEPVLASVVATVTERLLRERARGVDSWSARFEGEPPFPQWWVVVRDERGEVVGAGMRTAPFAPFPAFVLPMPTADAEALARAVHQRGELLLGVNGALPAVRVCAEETARLTGGSVEVAERTRLWEATDVRVPPPPPGRLRRVTEEDADLVLEWFTRFHNETDEQSGREPDAASGEHNTLDSVLVRIREGVEWLWELPDGEIAHLTGASLPSYGVSRIGPVFTPKPHRGRGLASYVVAVLTQRGLAAGQRMCLFTDQANPVSNGVYARIGYRPLAEMANLSVRL